MSAEKPIGAGDLVQIVVPRKCCANVAMMGVPFVVAAVWSDVSIDRCRHCGGKVTETTFVWAPNLEWCVELYRVKRIPPLSELEDERTEEELHCHG